MEEITVPSGSTFAVTLNGKPKEVAPGQNLADLLKELDLKERLVVVERNGSIVNRAEFPTISLADGDVLEIVHFVGGG